MNILIFDTEAIGISNKTAYNIGWAIYDTVNNAIIVKRDYVVMQVWRNKALFETAYYYKKRPLYISSLRGRNARLKHYGHIQGRLLIDIINFNVVGAYAFNSSYDIEVFRYNSEKYNCKNALEMLPIYDIRGYAVEYLMDNAYKQFCNDNANILNEGGGKKFITEADGYKTTAESFYSYLTDNAQFEEEHTALADSLIELEILKECLKRGAPLQENYQVAKCFPRNTVKTLTIKKDSQTLSSYQYTKKIQKQNENGAIIYIR